MRCGAGIGDLGLHYAVGHDEYWINRQLEKDHDELKDKLRASDLLAETWKAHAERAKA